MFDDNDFKESLDEIVDQLIIFTDSFHAYLFFFFYLSNVIMLYIDMLRVTALRSVGRQVSKYR